MSGVFSGHCITLSPSPLKVGASGAANYAVSPSAEKGEAIGFLALTDTSFRPDHKNHHMLNK